MPSSHLAVSAKIKYALYSIEVQGECGSCRPCIQFVFNLSCLFIYSNLYFKVSAYCKMIQTTIA